LSRHAFSILVDFLVELGVYSDYACLNVWNSTDWFSVFVWCIPNCVTRLFVLGTMTLHSFIHAWESFVKLCGAMLRNTRAFCCYTTGTGGNLLPLGIMTGAGRSTPITHCIVAWLAWCWVLEEVVIHRAGTDSSSSADFFPADSIFSSVIFVRRLSHVPTAGKSLLIVGCRFRLDDCKTVIDHGN
jgi:hypothetical protein